MTVPGAEVLIPAGQSDISILLGVLGNCDTLSTVLSEALIVRTTLPSTSHDSAVGLQSIYGIISLTRYAWGE